MRIVHTITGIEDEASGTSYVLPTLSRAMNRQSVQSDLVSVGADSADFKNGERTFPRRRFPRKLGRSPEMYRWLREQVSSGAVDIVHNHGIWMMPNVYPGWATRGSGVPLVVSPHGTFSERALGYSRTVKSVFWPAVQHPAIRGARLFHATAESEYQDIRRMGFRQPVAVIPNGVDIPASLAQLPRGDDRTLLFLGRIHPIKGVELLLEAWARLEAAHPLWKLRIVGPGLPSYVDSLANLAASLGVKRATFAGPLHGQAKTAAYQSADLVVLPSYSENFGMVVAEALAAACPVATTKGTPWSGLVEQGAGWWTEVGAEPLRIVLAEAMAKSPGELARMGAKGRAWMEREFSWSQIAEQMIESYRWVREGGTSPAWIFRD